MKEVWKHNVTLYLPRVLPDGTDDVDYRGPHVVGPVLVGGGCVRRGHCRRRFGLGGRCVGRQGR